MKDSGIILVLSGPSGVGKSTVIGHLKELLPQLQFSISCTTRQPRPGEVHGVQYYFCSDEEFQQQVAEGNMLEYAHVHTNSYGTPRQPVLAAVEKGAVMLLDIDVQGARQVRQALQGTPWEKVLLTVFLAPPSLEELEKRLRGRNTESAASLETRLKNARQEIQCANEYQFQVVNNVAESAAKELLQIIRKFQGGE